MLFPNGGSHRAPTTTVRATGELESDDWATGAPPLVEGRAGLARPTIGTSDRGPAADGSAAFDGCACASRLLERLRDGSELLKRSLKVVHDFSSQNLRSWEAVRIVETRIP